MAKKNPIAQALTALRNKKLTAEERSQIAQTASKSRWAGMSEEERKAFGRKLTAVRLQKRAGAKKAKKAK